MGANPAQEVLQYAGKNIKIIPNYKELLDVYNLSDCVILPLQSGGGVKGKLLEAAALKKIIITTMHGMEGTEFIAGEHVLLAENSNDFAYKCIYALLNKKECEHMAENAMNLFKKLYDWEIIGKEYNKYLEYQRVLQ